MGVDRARRFHHRWPCTFRNVGRVVGADVALIAFWFAAKALGA